MIKQDMLRSKNLLSKIGLCLVNGVQRHFQLSKIKRQIKVHLYTKSHI